MAIIVDPDNLDRQQVIFGAANQKISIKNVGALVHASLNDLTNGVTTGASRTFTSSGALFVTRGVTAGHVLCLFNKADAGHYIIESVDSETQLTVATDSPDFSNFTGATSIIFDVRQATGGNTVDGITLQAIYSFAKEEWRVDSRAGALSDDLIKYVFPYEPITREQMEQGGGSSHQNWTFFNEFTRKKVRTGGWANKNTAGTILAQYSGITTLGTLDSDAQAYYQLTDATTTPTNFTFKGAVNEPVKVYTDGGPDNRNYLKLFVRKKKRTYAQSQISDIGVTQLETIVNRFPLSHSVDPAISATDAETLGTAPFKNQRATAKATGSNGSKTNNQTTFSSSGATFQTNGVIPGDTLHITSGNQIGYYTISVVNSETQVTIGADADFTAWTSSESSLNFEITSANVIDPRTNGVIADVNGTTGTITSATGGFTAAVTVGDYVVITESGSNHRGVYKVTVKDSDTQLTVNTSDKAFTSVSNIDFYITKPGMYLQFKNETVISNPTTGDLTFNNANPDTIVRASGSWATDGALAGDIITISGSVSNNGTFTIATVAALTLTLVATDTLVNETATGGLGSGVNIYRNFKRVVNGVTYAFRWKIFGNNTTLQNVYQFIQHQLRQSTDIDFGPGTARGDITNALMSFATPTGTTTDLYIDDLAAADVNNVTFIDASGVSRTEKFIAAGAITFNSNLQSDASAVYTMFFTNDDAGDNTGRDYGTATAIIVNDAFSVPITGNVSAQSSVSFTYDYDGNIQRGSASAGVDAPITIVAIGLSTAQFVRFDGTIIESKANNFSLVASLERNYSNP